MRACGRHSRFCRAVAGARVHADGPEPSCCDAAAQARATAVANVLSRDPASGSGAPGSARCAPPPRQWRPSSSPLRRICPVAVSAESITRRCRPAPRWRRRSLRRGGLRRDDHALQHLVATMATLHSSWCLDAVSGSAAPARGHLHARSPRAIITPSASCAISSTRSTACGFSNLAITGVVGAYLLISRMSSALRTKLIAT